MTNAPPFDPTQYRVTFFFGPEPVDDSPDALRCVFNVKKRSWKGGFQVAVDMRQTHLARIRGWIAFQSWLNRLLQIVSPDEREDIRQRADDLFVQAVCTCKLTLALQDGLEQANQTISSEAFQQELDVTLQTQPEQILDPIRLELDLENASPPNT